MGKHRPQGATNGFSLLKIPTKAPFTQMLKKGLLPLLSQKMEAPRNRACFPDICIYVYTPCFKCLEKSSRKYSTYIIVTSEKTIYTYTSMITHLYSFYI